MLKNKKKILVAMILCLVFVSGCQSEQSSSQTGNGTNSEISEKAESEQKRNTNLNDDKKIEEALKKYREDRAANQKDFMISGLSATKGLDGGAEAYGLEGVDKRHNNLDSKESTEAFETAENYVKDTLKLDTKIYDCADPQILKIYDDKDKGVAKGYDKDNIDVLEYQEKDGTWSYLFLGKNGKGKPWKVLSHGKSYK